MVKLFILFDNIVSTQKLLCERSLLLEMAPKFSFVHDTKFEIANAFCPKCYQELLSISAKHIKKYLGINCEHDCSVSSNLIYIVAIEVRFAILG
jgi:hypothetical protein